MICGLMKAIALIAIMRNIITVFFAVQSSERKKQVSMVLDAIFGSLFSWIVDSLTSPCDRKLHSFKGSTLGKRPIDS